MSLALAALLARRSRPASSRSAGWRWAASRACWDLAGGGWRTFCWTSCGDRRAPAARLSAIWYEDANCHLCSQGGQTGGGLCDRL